MGVITRRAVIGGAAAVGFSPLFGQLNNAFGAATVTSGPFLIKTASNTEVDITDGVSGRRPLPAALATEWATILGTSPVVVSDALWAALPQLGAAIPVPPPPPPAPSPWPTNASTGVPAGTALTVRTTTWASSQLPNSPTGSELIGGKSYFVYTNSDFRASTQFMAVDEPYVVFRRCKFSATGTISNTMSLVQLQSNCEAAIFEDCTFDGGPQHNRCVWGDHGDITVRRCNFTRFGDSAVEKNDRTGTYSILVEDSYLNEVKGWPSAAHTDGVQWGGGKNMTVRRNTINVEPYNGTDGNTGSVSNSCIGGWAELGNITGAVLIDSNRLAGGGSCIYNEAKAPYSFQSSCTITNNVFDRSRYPSLNNTASVWFILAPNGLPSNLVWSNNKYQDGTAISLAQAQQATQ